MGVAGDVQEQLRPGAAGRRGLSRPQGHPLTSRARVRQDGPLSEDSQVPAGDFLALMKTSLESGRFWKVLVPLKAGPGILALTFALISWLLKLLCVKRAAPEE